MSKDEKFSRKLAPYFNAAVQGKQDYTITLTKPEADPARQAEAFCKRLDRWLCLQHETGAEPPVAAAAAPAGNAQLAIRCTEAAMLKIERQFAGEILRVDPPAEHQRGTIYPPKVDPWDVRYW